MGEHADEAEKREVVSKLTTHDGRPLSTFYYEKEPHIRTAQARFAHINFLLREAHYENMCGISLGPRKQALRANNETVHGYVDLPSIKMRREHIKFFDFYKMTRYLNDDELKIMFKDGDSKRPLFVRNFFLENGDSSDLIFERDLRQKHRVVNS